MRKMHYGASTGPTLCGAATMRLTRHIPRVDCANCRKKLAEKEEEDAHRTETISYIINLIEANHLEYEDIIAACEEAAVAKVMAI